MKISGSHIEKWRTFLRPLVFGIVAGLTAVAFQKSIHFLYDNGIARFAKMSTPEFLLYSFLALVGTAALSGLLVTRFCPAAAGSGSPQLKLAFWKDFGNVPWRVVWTKFLGSVLSIGGGSALGNEGPMVQIGGGIASATARKLGVPAHMLRAPAAAGAAAGLAAIFNAPMAAVAFVLEELVENLNSRLIGSILIAAVAGALTASFFMGDAAVFSIREIAHPGRIIYALTPLVATVASAAGVLFQKLALGVRRRNKAFARVPPLAKIVLGAACVWAIGSAVFLATGRLGVFFLGYEDLTAALDARLAWGVAGILFAAKILATVLCYGLGGVGGIFAPALFFGGTCGAALAGVFAIFLPEAVGTPELVSLAVVGMCACFGSVVRAPVTGVLLVFEMTHNFSMVPALMLGGVVSIAVSKLLTAKGFYDEVLEQDGTEISKIVPPRDLRTWQDSPASLVANFSPVSLREISEKSVKKFLAESAFLRVPVVDSAGRPLGLATRADLENANVSGDFSSVPVRPLKMCSCDDSLREVEKLLVESEHGIVALVGDAGTLVGLITLHDILRAEMIFAGE